jgi:hypothetical protein
MGIRKYRRSNVVILILYKPINEWKKREKKPTSSSDHALEISILLNRMENEGWKVINYFYT